VWQELSKKGQRTVYRLTLVKGYNAEEIENYARLVELGQPDFIEIKGVTFCGSSKGKESFFPSGLVLLL
jgi:tRNA wybutosine-synthesizing protein 1